MEAAGGGPSPCPAARSQPRRCAGPPGDAAPRGSRLREPSGRGGVVGVLGPRAEGTRGPLTPAVGPRLGARPRTGSQGEGEAW